MMILKMVNKDDDFYSYMGRFFGSRIVQTETKDRIYDDSNKIWYLCLDANNKVSAFLSINNDVIKNIYSTNESSLEELLTSVANFIKIKPSIVTKAYEDVYLKCGFHISSLESYKHFIMIRGDK